MDVVAVHGITGPAAIVQMNVIAWIAGQAVVRIGREALFAAWAAVNAGVGCSNSLSRSASNCYRNTDARSIRLVSWLTCDTPGRIIGLAGVAEGVRTLKALSSIYDVASSASHAGLSSVSVGE